MHGFLRSTLRTDHASGVAKVNQLSELTARGSPQGLRQRDRVFSGRLIGRCAVGSISASSCILNNAHASASASFVATRRILWRARVELLPGKDAGGGVDGSAFRTCQQPRPIKISRGDSLEPTSHATAFSILLLTETTQPNGTSSRESHLARNSIGNMRIENALMRLIDCWPEPLNFLGYELIPLVIEMHAVARDLRRGVKRFDCGQIEQGNLVGCRPGAKRLR